MRVTIYDKNPGTGFFQWFLKTSWFLGCVFQKLIGAVDAYYGAMSWDDAKTWLLTQKGPITMVQFWGHGGPGTLWFAGEPTSTAEWLSIEPNLVPESLIWFRSCAVFQGPEGQVFAKRLADGLNCTIAGHTAQIVGIFQGGLHTHKPNTMPSWPMEEGVLPSKWRTDFSPWIKNTITCFQWWIPKGW